MANIHDRWHSVKSPLHLQETPTIIPPIVYSRLSCNHMFSVWANSELEITALEKTECTRIGVNHPNLIFFTHLFQENTKRTGSNKLQGGEGNRCLEAAV